MPRGYWITCYREVRDVAKLTAYATLAGPAITAAGGRFLARGTPSKIYEAGQSERTVLIEFDTVELAIVAHESPAYRQALAALGEGAVRDIRIVAGS